MHLVHFNGTPSEGYIHLLLHLKIKTDLFIQNCASDFSFCNLIMLIWKYGYAVSKYIFLLYQNYIFPLAGPGALKT